VPDFSRKIVFFSMSLLLVLVFNLEAQQNVRPDSAAADSLLPKQPEPTVTVGLADTIPGDFFQIVDNLGLNSYTYRLITRFQTIPESVILQSLAEANIQVDYQRSNAYVVAHAIKILCQLDSLWNDFFSDLEIQIREPNIMRFNFRDDQKWKSYALNELFYSTFFQELLLIMGNIGIAESRDGKQWLAGWPNELRWKYREYAFEYMPEDMKIKVIDLRKGRGQPSAEEPSTIRILPSKPILPAESSDSMEPALKIPKFKP